jgi:hypothetical protein
VPIFFMREMRVARLMPAPLQLSALQPFGRQFQHFNDVIPFNGTCRRFQ